MILAIGILNQYIELVIMTVNVLDNIVVTIILALTVLHLIILQSIHLAHVQEVAIALELSHV